MSECDCNKSGYCTRYDKPVTDHIVYLCQSSPAHRDLFARLAAEAKIPDPMPPWYAIAWNACKSLVSIVTSGFMLSPKDIRAKRLEICAGCVHHDKGRCRTCGCFVRLKSLFAVEYCPRHKWAGEAKTIWGNIATPKSKGCGCGKS